MAAIGVSGVIFGIIRHFAGPPPRTLTGEYQEATNEYLKVRTRCSSASYACPGGGSAAHTDRLQTGAKGRAYHRCLERRLRWSWSDPEPVHGRKKVKVAAGLGEHVLKYSVERGLREQRAKQRAFPCVGCSRVGKRDRWEELVSCCMLLSANCTKTLRALHLLLLPMCLFESLFGSLIMHA